MCVMNKYGFFYLCELFIPALEPWFLDVCSSGRKPGDVFPFTYFPHLDKLLVIAKPRNAYV